MSMRAWIEGNPAVAAAIAVVLLLGALALLVRQTTEQAPGGTGAYFYNPDVDEFFAGPSGTVPPIETPTGGQEGVRAAIYACGECPAGIAGMSLGDLEQTDAFVGHFERYEDRAKQIIEQGAEHILGPEADFEEIEAAMDWAEVEGLLVRTAAGEQWHQADSQHGMNITAQAREICERKDESAMLCRP